MKGDGIMGDYFLLKKFEWTTHRFYTRVVVMNNVAVTDENKHLLECAIDIQKLAEEMKEVFTDERKVYEDSLAAYQFNLENGYYDKGFGRIEGWFFKNIYFKIHFKRYEEYFKIISKTEKKLNQVVIRLRYAIVTGMNVEGE